MNTWQKLLLPFIWLKRIRHRCGYGIHSPFAFNFVTRIIYNRADNLQYKSLRQIEQQKFADDRVLLRVKRLLFRLSNAAQPRTEVQVSEFCASSFYLICGYDEAEVQFAYKCEDLFEEDHHETIDLIFFNFPKQPELLRQAFDICVERTTLRSMLIVSGIGYSKQMRRLWKQFQDDPRTGISFDLYHLGIILFDLRKNKQHYIINF